MIGARALAVLGAILALGACAPAPKSSDRPAIAELHQRKCASCHRLVEPSTRARDEIESAAVRHEKRVRLSPDEWRALVDYLAPTATSAHVSVSGSWPNRARSD